MCDLLNVVPVGLCCRKTKLMIVKPPSWLPPGEAAVGDSQVVDPDLNSVCMSMPSLRGYSEVNTEVLTAGRGFVGVLAFGLVLGFLLRGMGTMRGSFCRAGGYKWVKKRHEQHLRSSDVVLGCRQGSPSGSHCTPSGCGSPAAHHHISPASAGAWDACRHGMLMGRHLSCCKVTLQSGERREAVK